MGLEVRGESVSERDWKTDSGDDADKPSLEVVSLVPSIVLRDSDILKLSLPLPVYDYCSNFELSIEDCDVVTHADLRHLNPCRRKLLSVSRPILELS